MNKCELSLSNTLECLKLLQDAKNPNNSVLYYQGINWIIDTLESGGIMTAQREEFMQDYYLQMKNK